VVSAKLFYPASHLLLLSMRLDLQAQVAILINTLIARKLSFFGVVCVNWTFNREVLR